METKEKMGLSKYFKKQTLAIVFYFLFLTIKSVSVILIAIFSAEAVELATLHKTEEAIRQMFNVLGLTALGLSCDYSQEMIYLKASNEIIAEMNLDMAKQAFKLNSRTYTDHGTGVFVSRIVNDPIHIVDASRMIVERIANVAKGLVFVTYIAFLNWWIGLIFASSLAFGMMIEFFKNRKLRSNTRKVKKLGDKINSLTTEIVRSEKDIKSLGLENNLAELSSKNYKEYRQTDRKRWVTNVNFGISRAFFLELVSIFVLILGIVLLDRVDNSGKALLTVSAFLLIYKNNGQLFNFVWNLGRILEDVTNIKISCERMFQLFDEDEFVTEKFGTKTLKKVKGNIEFKNVGFTFRDYEYPTADEKFKAKKNNEVATKKLIGETKLFDDLNFKVSPNTTVAFVGKSGSGKSTILNLMSKMIECETGAVLIDNVDIKELSKETLRNSISLVNQFPYIFDMSIKENLLLAKADATDKQIKDAIKKASLEEFVNSLPKGIDTQVGESGIKLSGGQKQRLAIARALLRKSSIIIFDESTSSLDNFAQEEVKQSIDGLKGESTIVIVAHRLSTIKNADTIYFLDNGKIVDQGTFEELYKRNKTFKTMFLAENI